MKATALIFGILLLTAFFACEKDELDPVFYSPNPQEIADKNLPITDPEITPRDSIIVKKPIPLSQN